MAREGSNLNKFDIRVLLASSYLLHSEKKMREGFWCYPAGRTKRVVVEVIAKKLCS